jgi:gas vesicle protein GvpL/GvpF
MGTTAPSGVAWYVYGVVDAAAEPPAAPAGVARHVQPLTEGGLTALVSPVALDEFGEEPVRARLEDSTWVEEKARAHEAVLEAALGTGAVVPFRFLTVYRDEAELRNFLAARRDELLSVLEGVRGKVEVGVKAFADIAALERSVAGRSPEVAELDAQIAGAQAGRAYLLQRRRDEAARAESARLVAEIARDSHARLLAAAFAGTANAVQPSELSGRPGQMVLNGAYLVPVAGSDLDRELGALAEHYAHLGISFERTGPWPPYNFVPRDLGAGDDA